MASSTSPLAAEAWRTATIASRATNLHNLAAWRNSTPVFGKPYLANLFGQNHLAKFTRTADGVSRDPLRKTGRSAGKFPRRGDSRSALLYRWRTARPGAAG